MRALMDKLKGKLNVESPIDSGRHVYCNWIPIMNRRGSHHPLTDPFRIEANKGLNMNYSKGMLPKTLDVLSRSLMIRHQVNLSEAELDEQVNFLNKAIRDL